jgi:hypothetical protein
MRQYVAYGLRVAATDDIPGLQSSIASGPADVRVSFGPLPASLIEDATVDWYRSHRLNALGRPNLVISRTAFDGAFRFIYDDGIEFGITSGGNQIWCSWPSGATVEDAAVYLRGAVLAFVLRLRGVLCLHASAIAVGTSAIAIVGAHNAGKSTMAAAFVKLGCRLLSDDVAAMDEKDGAFRVRSGYSRINLWPDAARILYGDEARLPRVAPPGGINDWWDKRYVELDPERSFQHMPLALGAIYVLGERASEGLLDIEIMSAPDAMIALVDATCVNYALDTCMRAKEFAALGHIVTTTYVRRLHPVNEPSCVVDLCRAILHDYETASSNGVTVRATILS